MPDAYGDNLPSWAIDPRYDPRKDTNEWMIAEHLRYEHGLPLHVIAKRTGLTFRDLRTRLAGDAEKP